MRSNSILSGSIVGTRRSPECRMGDVCEDAWSDLRVVNSFDNNDENS